MKNYYCLKTLLIMVLLIGGFISNGYSVELPPPVPNTVSGTPTASAQVGTMTSGTAGSVTYTITLPCAAGTGNGSTNLAYTWTSATPAGVTFDSPSVTLTKNLTSVGYTLTVSSDGSTAAGTYTFTVTTDSDPYTSANITLVVDAAAGSNNKVNANPTSGTQTGTLTEGIAGSVTYSITLPCDGGSLAGSTNLTYAWTSATPTGVTFDSPSATLTASSASVGYTLTVSTTAATAAGTYTFTVTTDSDPFTSADITLTVDAVAPPAGDIDMASGTNSYTQCGISFYDNGGSAGNYTDNFLGTTTFYPVTAGEAVTITFTSFNTESGWDKIWIYDGNSDVEPTLLSAYSGTTIPGPFTSSAADGSLTIKFDSDGGSVRAGWAADITCGIPPLSYCSSGATSTSYTEIRSVQLAGETITLNNVSGTTSAAYTNFTTGQPKSDLNTSGSYTINVGNVDYSSWCMAWIDFNYDGDFNDAGEYLGIDGKSSGPFAINFSVPAGATIGDTRLRVIVEEQSTASEDPCSSSFSWGETEDYTVTINSGVPCDIQDPSGVSVANISTSSAEISWTENGNSTAWDIEVSTGAFTNNPTHNNVSTNPYIVTGLTPSTTYYFQVRSECGGANSNWIDGGSFTTNACVAPGTQATNFSTSSVGPIGMTVNWTRGNGNNVLVVARQGSAVDADPVDGTSYTASSTFGSGNQIGTGNYVVYKGTGTSVAITNLLASTTYHFAIYEYDDGCGVVKHNLTQLTGNETTAACSAPTTHATSFTDTPSSTSINIGWTRGNGDNVLVVARPVVAVSADPVDGTIYSANSTFGSGDQLADGSYVIYSGTGTSVNVTALNQGTPYYFAIYELSNCGSYNTTELTGNSTTTTVSQLNYDFTASSGTFTPIGTSNSLSNQGSIVLPFDFEFGGCTTTTYSVGSTIKVHDAGWIGLSGTTCCQDDPLTTTFYGAIIAPFADDMSSANVIYWEVSGSSPNRVLIIEWRGNQIWNVGGSMDFQVKLYETTSKIEFIYDRGTISLPDADISGSIGLTSGDTDDYYTLVDASANPAVNYGPAAQIDMEDFPATGQIYTWELPTTMTYNSITVSAANPASAYPATTNQEITKVAIDVTGSCSAYYLTQMIINTAGTTDLTDVTNIDIFYTGNESLFSTSNLITTITPAVGDLTVDLVQMLQSGTNYFWIAFDVSETAANGNTLLASCSQISLTTIGNQAVAGSGSRIIGDQPDTYSKWIEQGWAKTVIETSDGNIVWAGGTSNTYSANGSGNAATYIVKTTSDLDSILWTTSIEETTRIDEIVEVTDGFVGVGYIDGWDGRGYDILVTKIDLSGNEVWTTSTELSGTDVGTGICLITTGANAGNVAICGNNTLNRYGFIAEIDISNGNIINQKVIADGYTIDFNDIEQTSDGGYIIAGASGDVSGNFLVIKLTSALAIEWDLGWGGSSGDALYYITENTANDYTVAGRSYSPGGFGSGDGYAMRFTYSAAKSSSIAWVKTYGSSEGESFYHGTKTVDGGYAFAGVGSRIGDPSNNEAYVVKVNSAGGQIFSKTIGTIGAGDQEGYGVDELTDNSIVVAGKSDLGGSSDAYLVKLTAGGFCCAVVQDNGGSKNLNIPIMASITPYFTATVPTKLDKTVTTSSGGVFADNGCNTVLPVEMVSFTAECNEESVELNWSTASEENNDYFVVETSDDGKNWNAINIVNGAGDSNTLINYEYTDYGLINEVIFYRLKQVDLDGRYENSDIIAVNCANNELNEIESIDLYPNPAKDKLILSF